MCAIRTRGRNELPIRPCDSASDGQLIALNAKDGTLAGSAHHVRQKARADLAAAPH
jgi:hypothetical protein